MSDDTLFLLRSVSLFAESPPELLSELASHMEEVRVRAGEVVVLKDDPGDCLYIVAEGRLRASDGERVLNELRPRDLFGEMSVLDAEPRSATIVAVEDSRLLKLQQRDLYALLAREPQITRELIRILTRRLRARMRDMASDYDYMQQFGKVTSAAVAIEAGVYEPEQLDGVAGRRDELGLLARVFQRAIRQVYDREQRLIRQVAELRIEIDEARKAQRVAEITETDYFQQLRRRAGDLRRPTSPSAKE